MRDPTPVKGPSENNIQSPQVLQWLQRQQQEKTPRRNVRSTKRSLQHDIENQKKVEDNKVVKKQENQACKRLNSALSSVPLQNLSNDLNIQEQYADMGVQRLEPDTPSVVILSPRKREQNDRLIGAIALVELAHGIGL